MVYVDETPPSCTAPVIINYKQLKIRIDENSVFFLFYTPFFPPAKSAAPTAGRYYRARRETGRNPASLDDL